MIGEAIRVRMGKRGKTKGRLGLGAAPLLHSMSAHEAWWLNLVSLGYDLQILKPHGGLFPYVETCFHMLRTLSLASHHRFRNCPRVHLNIEGI